MEKQDIYLNTIKKKKHCIILTLTKLHLLQS